MERKIYNSLSEQKNNNTAEVDFIIENKDGIRVCTKKFHLIKASYHLILIVF